MWILKNYLKNWGININFRTKTNLGKKKDIFMKTLMSLRSMVWASFNWGLQVWMVLMIGCYFGKQDLVILTGLACCHYTEVSRKYGMYACSLKGLNYGRKMFGLYFFIIAKPPSLLIAWFDHLKKIKYLQYEEYFTHDAMKKKFKKLRA